MSSIQDDRKTFRYRFLESLIGLSSLSFLILLVIFSLFDSTRIIVSIFLIVYSFLWVLKLSLNANYTIYTYNQVRRWETFDWDTFYQNIHTHLEKAISQLVDFQQKFRHKLDWKEKLDIDIQQLKAIQGTKFADPKNIIHINIFSIYNEPVEVLLKSLQKIYDSKYNLKNLVVFVSQEARNGGENNSKVRSIVNAQPWISSQFVLESDLDIVYSENHFAGLDNKLDTYKNDIFRKIKISNSKLNVIFTEHPDGLVGEVKGKASNEDWGARQASLFVKARGLDPELILVTSLDADSHINPYFYHNLSYRYCLTPNRLQAGFQPVHIYSNNFFKTGLWPRQVASQTTLHNMGQLAIDGETSFFAIYSVPLVVLQKVNFWVREVIAEDSVLFIKCLAYFKGNFHVYPFYGIFEGDAVEADDYFEAIAIQYKQLQRWAWGGVEGFPYMFKKFFLEKDSSAIDLRVRLRWIFLQFTNHFFWSSTPLLFSVGILIPQLFGDQFFQSTPIAQNLSIFSQYFAWLSFVFLGIFSYITIRYIGSKAMAHADTKWYHWFLVGLQCLISPLIFFAMGIPGLDAQIRGVFGKYLTYLVTPKK